MNCAEPVVNHVVHSREEMTVKKAVKNRRVARVAHNSVRESDSIRCYDYGEEKVGAPFLAYVDGWPRLSSLGLLLWRVSKPGLLDRRWHESLLPFMPEVRKCIEQQKNSCRIDG